MADAPSASSSKTEISTQAVISWVDSDGQVKYLYQADPDPSRQVTFDLHFHDASLSALLRVRVPVDLKAFPSGKTPLYLYIYADRITSIVCDSSSRIPDGIPDEIRGRLGTGLISLHLDLSKPADMVVPMNPLVPTKKKGHGERLDAFRSLAQATSWIIYLTGGSLPSEALLETLCSAVARGDLKPLLGEACLSGLYCGKGGKVLEGSNAHSWTVPPPSYDEVEPPPPAPPLYPPKLGLGATQGSRSKRRRDSSGSRNEEDVETVCKNIVERLMTQYRKEDREFLQSELKQMKADILANVDERMHKLEDELGLANVYSKEEVDEEIEQVQDFNEKLIDVKVEDRMEYIKHELEEYVENQLEGAEERLLGCLSSASLRLEIDHPNQ